MFVTLFKVGSEYSQNGPDDDHRREPDARRNLLDDDSMGELTDSHTVQRGYYDVQVVVLLTSTYPAVVTARTLL